MAPAMDWAASASEKKRNCCHYPRTSQTSDHIRHTTWNLHCCLLPRTFGNRQPVSPLSGTSDRYISASQLLMIMQTPPSPSKKPIPFATAFEIRNRFSKPRPYSLEWPLSARRRCYRIGCRRSRGDPLTQTQSPTKSFKPQPTSKTCPSPAIPYSIITPLPVLTHSTLPIQIRATVVFQVVIVNPSSTHRRTLTN